MDPFLKHLHIVLQCGCYCNIVVNRNIAECRIRSLQPKLEVVIFEIFAQLLLSATHFTTGTRLVLVFALVVECNYSLFTSSLSLFFAHFRYESDLG